MHPISFQIYGPESSGKTTLALHAIAEVQVTHLSGFFLLLLIPWLECLLGWCQMSFGIGTHFHSSDNVLQKLGGNAMLVDAEHAFDPAYSKSLGVDVENLIVCQPDHGEMALESNTVFTLLVVVLKLLILVFVSYDVNGLIVISLLQLLIACVDLVP